MRHCGTIITDQGGSSRLVAGDAARVRRVHVVFKTHLDLGFTDYAKAVEHRYFDEFFPKAMDTADELARRGGAERLVWTTGSWLLHTLLEGADSALRRRVEHAIQAGHLAWHALPFTTHSELLDPGLFEFGLGLAAQLDARFGRRTIAAKMTDVPGHTRGIVPLLAKAGIRFLHLGVNPFSCPLAVPRWFVWRSPEGGEEILVQYDAEDYGITAMPAGADFALALVHAGDNQGPPTATQVVAEFARLRELFPAADIRAGTLDDFAAEFLKERPGSTAGAAGRPEPPLLATLPVVVEELGDSWIHGVASAPGKVAAFRALLRLRQDWRTLPDIAASPSFAAFSERLLCVAEHTWGMSRANLDDYEHYSNERLGELRQTERCRRVEASWREQEAYVDQAVEALSPMPQWQKQASVAVEGTLPRRTETAGWGKWDPHTPIETPFLRAQLDAATGALAGLQDKRTGYEWGRQNDGDAPPWPEATGGAGLGLFSYQVFSQATCETFLQQYGRWTPRTESWGPISFARPGFDPEGLIEDSTWHPEVRQAWIATAAEAIRVLVRSEMPRRPVESFGCPAVIEQEWRFHTAAPVVELTMQCFDRQACRLPDAIWCSFVPRVADTGRWRLRKLGTWIDPLEVRRGGNRNLHAVQDAVEYHDGHGAFRLDTLDAPLVAPGRPSLYDFSQRQPEPGQGIHVNLWNNMWNTNFPYWDERNLKFRFRLQFGDLA